MQHVLAILLALVSCAAADHPDSPPAAVSIDNGTVFNTTWVEHRHEENEEITHEAGASAFLVSVQNAELVFVPQANSTFVRIDHTVIGGDELLDGRTNLQPSWDACAVDCAATPTCISFNWCSNQKESCPLDFDNHGGPYQSCQLIHSESAEESKGVLQIGSGNPKLGDGGARVLIDPPAEVPPGYTLFMAQSLQDVYDLPCEDSPTPGQCTLFGTQQELVDRCSGWPECQAVVVGPRGWGRFQGIPFGELKGQNDSSLPLDPAKGNVNPTTYTLVKTSALPPEESSGGLSAGAVAGIVVAAVVVVACAIVAAAFLVRRRRKRGVLELKLSGGTANGGSEEEIVASFGREKGGGGSGATAKLVAKLLSEAPSPQWADVIVPREAIKFSTKNGKAVRLGAGSSGTVFRGLLHGATPVALKVYSFELDMALPKYFIQEAVMLRRMSHPNIIQFLGVTVAEGRGLLIMELAGSDLGKVLHEDAEAAHKSSGERQYAWYNRGRHVAMQIASAIAYLHSQKVLHLDLKSGNVLLTSNGIAKVCDVGFSRFMQATHVSGLDGRVGTWHWCAPEVLLGGRATEASDIYSFGIVLWEIVTGQQPMRGCITPLEAPEQCPAEIADLHARCVRQEPTERPSVAEVVQVIRAALGSPNPQASGSIVLEIPPMPPKDAKVSIKNLSGISAGLVSCPSDAAPPPVGSTDVSGVSVPEHPSSPHASGLRPAAPSLHNESRSSTSSVQEAAPAAAPPQPFAGGSGAKMSSGDKFRGVAVDVQKIVSPFAAASTTAQP